MDVATMLKKDEFCLRQYVTPASYFDPRQEIIKRQNADYKNRPPQQKFKPTTKHKPCFLDEQIHPLTANPSPDKYKTTQQAGFFDAQTKARKNKSADALKKVNPSLKKWTYIDDIERYEAKHKPPGVGKFDLLKEPFQKKHIKLKQTEVPTKLSQMDDVKFLSAGTPGVGHYNPHDSVPHIRPNRQDYKFYKEKHARETLKRSKSAVTRLGPTSYNPVAYNTFDSIAKNKKVEKSRWTHGDIDLRKGSRSQHKSPSPAEYNLMNQWSATKLRQRESDLGKVGLFQRTARSVKAFSVYH